MKEYKYLYQKMLDPDLILKAYKKLRKGKTKRKEIQYIDAHLEEEIQKMRDMILNTRPCEVNRPDLAYIPKRHIPKVINEHGKERIIYMPEIHEQWLHHIIIQILGPIIMSTAHSNVCGSFPGRGVHYGKRKITKWIKSKRGMRYYAKMDIRHFYNNVRLRILFQELQIRIKDDWFLYILELCLSTFKKGLPLGYYISQWLANYMLEPLDKMIESRFDKYVRYMDDIVIFDSDIRSLKMAVNKVSEMLVKRFKLKLKNNYQVVKFVNRDTGRPVDFMGFIFYRNRTIMRKTIMLKASRLAAKIQKRVKDGKKLYKKMISGMISYIGWFSHTDTYQCYVYWIKPCLSLGILKRIISRIDRRNNRDRMEGNKILRGA